MRNTALSISICMLSIGMLHQSCKSTQATTTAIQPREETVVIPEGDKVKINRFVSVDGVSDLRAGMTIAEVQSKLSAKPYNILSAQADGHHVIHYKYRLNKVEVPTADMDKFGVEKLVNKQFYAPGEEDLYIVFNGTGKLEYMVSSQGSINEKLLRENNLLYVIKKDKDKFASDTDKSYRVTNSNVFYPMLVCPSCGEKKEDPKPASEPNTIKIKLEPSGKN